MADAKRWGIDLNETDLDPDGANGVWAENLAALIAFLSVQSQWRTVIRSDGKMIATGLDYAGVQVGLDMAKIEITPELWADFRVIESAARAALNGGGNDY